MSTTPDVTTGQLTDKKKEAIFLEVARYSLFHFVLTRLTESGARAGRLIHRQIMYLFSPDSHSNPWEDNSIEQYKKRVSECFDEAWKTNDVYRSKFLYGTDSSESPSSVSIKTKFEELKRGLEQSATAEDLQSWADQQMAALLDEENVLKLDSSNDYLDDSKNPLKILKTLYSLNTTTFTFLREKISEMVQRAKDAQQRLAIAKLAGTKLGSVPESVDAPALAPAQPDLLETPASDPAQPTALAGAPKSSDPAQSGSVDASKPVSANLESTQSALALLKVEQSVDPFDANLNTVQASMSAPSKPQSAPAFVFISMGKWFQNHPWALWLLISIAASVVVGISAPLIFESSFFAPLVPMVVAVVTTTWHAIALALPMMGYLTVAALGSALTLGVGFGLLVKRLKIEEENSPVLIKFLNKNPMFTMMLVCAVVGIIVGVALSGPAMIALPAFFHGGAFLATLLPSVVAESVFAAVVSFTGVMVLGGLAAMVSYAYDYVTNKRAGYAVADSNVELGGENRAVPAHAAVPNTDHKKSVPLPGDPALAASLQVKENTEEQKGLSAVPKA